MSKPPKNGPANHDQDQWSISAQAWYREHSNNATEKKRPNRPEDHLAIFSNMVTPEVMTI